MNLTISGTDIFFGFQILMAWFFAVPQTIRMMENVQGVTINWPLCADLFVILNLWLAIGTHKKIGSRATLQTLLIYANFVLLATPMAVIAFLKCPWTPKDTVVISVIGGLVAVVVGWAYAFSKPLSDPAVRGMLVGLFRVVPHFYLSYCIVSAGGGAGIAAKSVLAANITASARIVTLVQSGWKIGWDRNLAASLLSEIGNEASWLLVTGIWFLYR